MAELVLQNAAPTSRVHRRPKHKFIFDSRPFQIQPIAIAPVLPAETLSSWWFEVRQVTKPILNGLIGWSTEYYCFYVKIRDLDDRDTLDDLFINPTASITALNGAANTQWYHAGTAAGTAPNFLYLCTRRIVDTWFRDDGEAASAALIDGYYAAQIRDQGWMDSLADTTVLSAGAGDPGATTTPEALDKLMDAYDYLRSMSLTQMTFEDYVRTFGIQLATETVHKPELLFSHKEWQYPSNTIDPADGSATSAVSWVVKKSGREAKLFKEPGFIVMINVIRPKVYFGRQMGSLAHHLDQGLSWLPAIMAQAPETSLREFTGGDTGNGPLSQDTLNIGPTNGYWVDMRDLFLYGDQFMNFAPGTAGKNQVSLPTAALGTKYASLDDVKSLYTDVDNAFVNADGFLSLDIKGSQIDYTVGREARA